MGILALLVCHSFCIIILNENFSFFNHPERAIPLFCHSERAFGRGRIPAAISSKYSRSVFPEIDYLFSVLDTFENGYFSARIP
ncbi:MAG: hypothetical protein JJE07_12530 [Flavobacteriaceae bacterium]|nr:hypothetical protein [Flavobacteriaceae bacterium]